MMRALLHSMLKKLTDKLITIGQVVIGVVVIGVDASHDGENIAIAIVGVEQMIHTAKSISHVPGKDKVGTMLVGGGILCQVVEFLHHEFCPCLAVFWCVVGHIIEEGELLKQPVSLLILLDHLVEGGTDLVMGEDAEDPDSFIVGGVFLLGLILVQFEVCLVLFGGLLDTERGCAQGTAIDICMIGIEGLVLGGTANWTFGDRLFQHHGFEAPRILQ